MLVSVTGTLVLADEALGLVVSAVKPNTVYYTCLWNLPICFFASGVLLAAVAAFWGEFPSARLWSVHGQQLEWACKEEACARNRMSYHAFCELSYLALNAMRLLTFS